ncbi:MAG: NAD(P)/FAD-dependent oxidoreductase [Candidatus Binatia bacterium]
MHDVIVIGAGMAGVTAARELCRAGLDAVVVEARDRVGGRVWSIRDFCDAPIEGGAEFVHGTDAMIWPDIRAAGLDVRACPQIRNTMLNLGGPTRWLPWAMMHPALWQSFPMFWLLRRATPPDMSAREFIDKHRFRGRARLLAEMILTAHLPGSLDEVGIQGLLEDNVLKLETGLHHRVEAGYDSLPRRIAQGLDIRHGFKVDSIHRSERSVTIVSGDGREMTARAAICTLPLGVIQQRRVRFEPELPASKTSALEQLVMGPVTKVLLHFDHPIWPDWLSLLPCPQGPVTLYWPVFFGSLAERPPVLTAYATGPRALRLSTMSDEEVAAMCTDDLERLFPGNPVRRLLRGFQRVDWAADELACGGYSFVRPGGTGSRRRLAAADTGALFWAGSATVNAPIAATVEGAFASGLRAAAEVLEYLDARPSPTPLDAEI